jgi:hypothetical protein
MHLCRSISHFLSRLFPDRSSRFIAAIAALLSLALSVWWLVNTIQSKWLYSISHPQQVISWEQAPSLPSFFEIAFVDGSAPWRGNASYYRILPIWRLSWSDDNIAGFMCARTEVYNLSAAGEFCIPTNEEGQPLMGLLLAPGDQDGSSARNIPLASYQSWPQQFLPDLYQTLAFQVFLFVNLSLLPPTFDYPSAYMYSLTPQQSAAQLEHPEVQPDMARYAEVGDFIYGARYQVHFSASRVIRLSGEEEVKYDYSLTGGHPLTSAQQSALVAGLINRTDNAVERATITSLSTDPHITIFCLEVDVTPNSLGVQTITEVSTYKFSTFFSELGGALNLLALVLILLFPLTAEPTKPRKFVILWIIEQWRQSQAHVDVESEEVRDEQDIEKQQHQPAHNKAKG